MTDIGTRKNVHQLEGDWAEPILWYARGVKAMKARQLREPTSWHFFAAIHGIRRELWDFYRITDSAEPNPGDSDRQVYLDQCQHQSWFFLPWHRGYLLALEAVLRKEIELQGGPFETWRLPYWNYFASDQNVLPPAFQTPDWPDGADDNPLFVEQRWGPLSDNTPIDVTLETNLDAMDDRDFTGPGGGGGAGFGGPATGFNVSGGTNGGLEADPHNVIHGLIGGSHPTLTFPGGRPLFGLMSSPLTAALDPIFYLHHCNIDRLWESWNTFPPEKPANTPTDWKNPTDPNWLEGPGGIGDREFAMPNPDASTWIYTPREMQEIANLGYIYDDLAPGVASEPLALAARIENLGLDATTITASEEATMASQSKVELIGASESGLSLVGSEAIDNAVKTEAGARTRVSATLSGSALEAALPDRVFLNLENITGLHDAVIFRVYVGLPQGADPSENREYLAGNVSLFGVSQASDPSGKHAGAGINYTLEITKIVDRLFVENSSSLEEVSIKFVPREAIPAAAKVEIGRISIYRQFD